MRKAREGTGYPRHEGDSGGAVRGLLGHGLSLGKKAVGCTLIVWQVGAPQELLGHLSPGSSFPKEPGWLGSGLLGLWPCHCLPVDVGQVFSCLQASVSPFAHWQGGAKIAFPKVQCTPLWPLMKWCHVDCQFPLNKDCVLFSPTLGKNI